MHPDTITEQMRLVRDAIGDLCNTYRQHMLAGAQLTEPQAFTYSRLQEMLVEARRAIAMHIYGGEVPLRGSRCSYLDVTSGKEYDTMGGITAARGTHRQTLHQAVSNGLALGERSRDPWVLAYSVDPTSWTVTITPLVAITIPTGRAAAMKGVTTTTELLEKLGQ